MLADNRAEPVEGCARIENLVAEILKTILPIFVIILLGWSLRRLDFMQEGFVKPANRLVYYVAIPAMIFREIAEAEFLQHFSLVLVAATLAPLILVALAGLILARGIKLERHRVGSFLQCSFHGNLGYIGLAVAFYFLGNEGFTRASILAGFVMLLQNFLAVVALSRFNKDPEQKVSTLSLVRRVLLNPVIISAMAGMAFSLLRLGLPVILDRSLRILSGMALPLALLVIGTSISFAQMRQQLRLTALIALLKLLLLPASGLILFYLLELHRVDYLPALILLASPSATVSYVMASEMAGDADMATAAISVTTLVSAVTFTLWLSLGS
ncbi:MAG: AEC family transporter [Deltaproteobacteria bacterium]|nr:AEC family transporter [Deltaproteobacteria bacterium]